MLARRRKMLNFVTITIVAIWCDTTHVGAADDPPAGAGGRNHPPDSRVIPSFSITRRDRRFAGTVNATTSGSASTSGTHSAGIRERLPWRVPDSSDAVAIRQPISTHGVKCASNGTCDSPTIPTNSPVARSSAAKNPKPCRVHVGLYALDHRVALRGQERRRKELHHARIGIHAAEWFAIALLARDAAADGVSPA